MKYPLLFVFIAGMGSLSQVKAVVPFTDDFSTNHDYFTLGVSGTGWDGILNSGALGSASQASGGVLTWQETGGHGWEGAQHDAPYLYLNVTGDFSASVQVITAGSTGGTFSTGGLLANDFAGGTKDWVQLTYSTWQGRNRFVSVNDNSHSETGFQEPIYNYLRMDRTGSDFTYYGKANSGDSWTQLTTINRSDIGSTMQIGLQFSKFSGGSGQIVYDNFVVVPEPSSALLAAAGLAAISLRRRRSS